LTTWVHRIVVNTALDRLRAARAGVAVVRAAAGASDEVEARQPEIVDDRTPEDLLGRAEVGQVVRGVMDELSPAHREILALRELEGESYQAISHAARCPVGTVMSRLHNARRRFAERMTALYPDFAFQST